ncbi:4-oxalocrotonate tautomerase family protein [Massilia solisilvae]|uniref:Tautomerase n=1 Tax=Massilia solisilvae TaxID=1811225 RepID=A0ABT2BKT8_9BURK|nr:2-hydroxymuconate tautomerase [Massilia solisilvae]MCS0609133.1 4-oxalocrotonate tautomerase family protein [Massilia solisilvae]
MPICQIHLIEGRTVEQKRLLIEKITDAVHEAIGAPRESVRVILSEMPKEHFGIGGKTAGQLGR